MSIFRKSRKKRFEEFNKAYLFYKVSFYKFLCEEIVPYSDSIGLGDEGIFASKAIDLLLCGELDFGLYDMKNSNVARAKEILPLIYAETEVIYEIDAVRSILLPLLEWKYIRLGKLFGDVFMESAEGKNVLRRINGIPSYIRDTEEYKDRRMEMVNSYKSIFN